MMQQYSSANSEMEADFCNASTEKNDFHDQLTNILMLTLIHELMRGRCIFYFCILQGIVNEVEIKFL
jgi:hypothetical protein